MGPVTSEGHVVIGVAGDVEPVGVVELPVVVVGRDPPEHHLVALGDPATGQFLVAGGGPPEVCGHRGPAQDLLHGRSDERRVVAQGPHLVGVVHERPESLCQRVPGGVVAGRHQQGEEVVELQVAQRLAVGGWFQEARDDVVVRATPAFGGGLLGVPEDLKAGRAAERDEPELVGVHLVHHVVGVLRVRVRQQLVAPVHELLGVLVGYSQKATQHPHGQHPGHLGDEVELAQGQGVVQDPAGQVADRILVGLHGPAGEATVHQASQPGVVRRVQLHHGSTGLGLLGVHLLQPDPLERGEVVPPVVGVDHVGVAGHRPEARSVLLVHPRDGFLVAESFQGGVGHAVDPGVVGCQVRVAVV